MQNLIVLWDNQQNEPGAGLPKPIQQFYGGDLAMPQSEEAEASGRAIASSNFVSRLDGVVNIPDAPGGKVISGGSEQDLALMSVLRAAHDAVLVGSETLSSEPKHKWTARFVYAPFADMLENWRVQNGKSQNPLNIIVSRSGMVRDKQNPEKQTALSLKYDVFNDPEIQPVIITTSQGLDVFKDQLQANARIKTLVIDDAADFEKQLLKKIRLELGVEHVLIEGGPRLFASFNRKGLITDFFQTIAPGMAGRAKNSKRLTIMDGDEFPADQLPMPQRVSVRGVQETGHLMIREHFK